MKKVFMAITAAAMLSLVACGGGNKSANGESTTDQKTEEAAPATSANLDQYLQLINEATPLLEKVAGGDAEATAKYTEIAQKMSSLVSNLQTELANKPELLKKFQEASQKFAEAAQNAAASVQK